MSRSQRAKGQRWEQEVARKFRDALPGAGVFTGRQSGKYDSVPDVIAGPFAIEAKVGANPPSAHSIITQARETCGDLIPVGVVKRDRQPPYLILPLDDGLRILGEWYAGRSDAEVDRQIVGVTMDRRAER